MDPRRSAEIVAGVLATVAMVVGAATTGDQAPIEVDWGPLAAVVIGVWSVVATRWPRVSVLAAPVTAFVCFSTVLPAFPIGFAPAVPLYVAGRRGHLWWGVAAVSVTVLFSAGWRLLGEPENDALQVLVDSLRDAVLLVTLLLLGDALRSRQRLRHEAALEREVREAEHQRRLTDLRLDTARDLHDVLAHTLTVASIHGGVAAEALDDEPERARWAVQTLRRAVADAMTDLRGTVALLRDPGRTATESPAPGLDDLAGLAASTRASGLEVALTVPEAAEVRPAIGLAAYRVVQEALTNSLRHSGAARVEVVVRQGSGTEVAVRDDGRRPPGPPGAGLTGMAERVRALGGTLRCGPRADGDGFEVVAWFP